MSEKAIGVAMSMGKVEDLRLPAIPTINPSNPTTVALEALAGELVSVCRKVNSLLAKLRKGGYLEFF